MPDLGARTIGNSPERASSRSDRRARVLLCAVDLELELDLPADAVGPRRVLEESSVVRTGEAVFGERESWVVCTGFEKWEGNERQRKLWEWRGGSIKWD